MADSIHQKIRAFLETAANQGLVAQEQAIVDAHLAECNECRAYAQNLNELQDGLRRVMQQQWNIQSALLPLQRIKERSKRAALQNKVSGAIGRFAVVPLLALAFVMAVRMIAPQQSTPNTPVMTLRTPQLSRYTPTPSYRTATEFIIRDCETVIHIVQDNDTLDGIAARYGVLKESIVTYNGLTSDRMDANTRLVIPLCTRTPTSTGASTTPTITITTRPQNEGIDPSPSG